MTTTTDRNGTYTEATYSDGRKVHVYGNRNGFAYIAFVDDLGWVTKVPESWVTMTHLAAILAGHGFDSVEAARAALVVAVCPRCESIVQAPDAGTATAARKYLDLSCCGADAAVLI